jgi:hypothetical protein
MARLFATVCAVTLVIQPWTLRAVFVFEHREPLAVFVRAGDIVEALKQTFFSNAYDNTVKSALGIEVDDLIVGFIYVGTDIGPSPAQAPRSTDEFIEHWTGARA